MNTLKSLGIFGSVRANQPEIYQRTLNQEVKLLLGPHHAARFLVNCVNGAKIDELVRKREWSAVRDNLIAAAQCLASAEVEALVICGGVQNHFADEVGRTVGLPVIDMVRAMDFKLRCFNSRRAAFVGVGEAKEERMWRAKDVRYSPMFPSAAERDWIMRCADSRWGKDGIPIETRATLVRIVTRLRREGADAFVIVDPVLGQWVTAADAQRPVFIAAEVHARAAAGWSLSDYCRPAGGCVAEIG